MLDAPHPYGEDDAVQAPKASENFRCLCTGEKGLGKASKKALHYKVCCPAIVRCMLFPTRCPQLPSHLSDDLMYRATDSTGS